MCRLRTKLAGSVNLLNQVVSILNDICYLLMPKLCTMDADKLYKELTLWEQFRFSEDASWTDGLSVNCDGEQLLGTKSFWEAEDHPDKILGNACLGIPFSGDKSPGDDPLADWLDDRIDIEEIDELVNNPEFDADVLDVSSDVSMLLDDATSLPFETEAVLEDASKEDAEESGDCSTENGFDGVMAASPAEQHGIVVIDGYVPSDEATNGDFQPATPGEMVMSPVDHHSTVVNDESVSCISCSTVGSILLSPPPPSPSEIPTSSKASATGSRKGSARSCRRSKPYTHPNKRRHSSSDSWAKSEWDDDSDFAPLSSRKARKRDQNKSAATRYRNKKRASLQLLTQEEIKLREINKQLKSQVTQLQTEVNYLKSLMKEILIAKGLLKK